MSTFNNMRRFSRGEPQRQFVGQPTGDHMRPRHFYNISLIDIGNAIKEWPSKYRTKTGEIVIARRPAEIGSVLSRHYRGASRLDASDYRQLGARVVVATYAQSVRPTGRFIDVVVLPEGMKL